MRIIYERFQKTNSRRHGSRRGYQGGGIKNNRPNLRGGNNICGH